MQRVTLAAALALLTIAPAVAQERGGVPARNPTAVLDQIDANRGCPFSATSVTVGVNRATATRSAAQQQIGTAGAVSAGCQPLVSTQVAAGVNLALGRGSQADQSLTAQGPRGILATTTYSRGYNYGYGSGSLASQRILNTTSR